MTDHQLDPISLESISLDALDDVTGGNALKWARDTVRAGGVALGLLTHDPAAAAAATKAIGVQTQQIQRVERGVEDAVRSRAPKVGTGPLPGE